jgi:hypothetical protein
MLRTASSLPLAGLLTLGSDPARFPAEPPACYRASWQLPGPDFHRQATTSLRTTRSAAQNTASPPALLGARKPEVSLAGVSIEQPGADRAVLAPGSRIAVLIGQTARGRRDAA